MSDLATFRLTLSQLHPGAGEHGINTCGNPDCSNFGQPPRPPAERLAEVLKRRPDLTEAQIKLAKKHGPGAYRLSGTEKHHGRVSTAFRFKQDHHAWRDQRTVRCSGHTSVGEVCNGGFSILSPEHLAAEVQRLRTQNGVLDGPKCGACWKAMLETPDEFAFDGRNERAANSKGEKIKKKATATAIRVVHRPCRGKPGGRFTVSLPHAGQQDTSDNLRIYQALMNSAGIGDVQRAVGAATSGAKLGVSRIYDRVLWLESVFLAYKREMLRRWRENVEKSGKPVEHLLSHDDIVLTANWETSSDRRNTQLNCAVTADAKSGYVYRIDVDFDPNIRPLDLFRQTYLDAAGQPQNIEHRYGDVVAPRFSWLRPTGRLHERQFFAACVNEYKAFKDKAERSMPSETEAQEEALAHVLARADEEIARIREISEGWFGFPADKSDLRGSFRGVTTRDTYTKAAHFVLIKEMLPAGRIVLTTEQEATLPPLLPHIFEQEIREDRFVWLAMRFDKEAKKPERIRKVKAYKEARYHFLNDGMYDGRFDERTDARVVSEAFIQKYMSVAAGVDKEGRPAPFQVSNYKIEAFPSIWVRSPTQTGGEIDKTVGFPILPRYLRRRLKSLPWNAPTLEDELREELAPWVYTATLQPASSFMNALRERLSFAQRAGTGGARLGGSYVQGASYNPRYLIALLNIFRVHYNFFELRPYSRPYDIDARSRPRPQPMPRGLRFPGTNDIVALPPRRRRSPPRLTPAQRHGIETSTRPSKHTGGVPDIHRVLYRPWLFAGTKFAAAFERSRNEVPRKSRKTPGNGS